MNRRLELPQVLVSVDLARETDFALGSLHVRPSRRQVLGSGCQQTIQPRTMQVLVALVRAKGGVLSREELIESCWDGITVGDDAINRCIAKVRQIAELGGGAAFEIETIPRVGYRLQAADAPTPPDVAAQNAPACESASAAPAETARPPLSQPLPRKWIGIGVGAALVLAGGIAVARLVWPHENARWAVVQTELPIATTLIERHPAISPDGTMIAYSAGPDVLSRKIYLKRVTGGDSLKLTDDAYDDASPTWSPDGSQIAYVAYRPGDPCRLMMVPALAGASHELLRCHAAERSSVVWSVSGKELFFVDKTDTKTPDQIMRFSLESGERTQLTHPPRGILAESGPAVSPDGRWIAFLRQTSEALNSRVVRDLATGAERVLIQNDYAIDSEAWSEDSQSVFTIDSDDAQFEIWAHPLNGDPPQRIFSTPDVIARLNSGPHGLLAVEIDRYMSGLARPPATGAEAPQFLETDNGNAFTPDIASDGSIVAGFSRSDGSGLWLIPAAGRARKLIALDREAAAFANPRWSPDGTRIAYTFIGTDSVGIRVIAATGAIAATIHFDGKEICAPAWSANGHALIFPGHDGGGWRLWRVDLARPERVMALPQRGWVSVRSYNDALYGVREGTPGIWRIDPKPRRIADAVLLQPDHWTVSAQTVAWLEYGKQRLIRTQLIDGGPARLLAQVPNYAGSFGFAIDPVSGSVVYVAHLARDAGDIELLHLARQ